MEQNTDAGGVAAVRVSVRPSASALAGLTPACEFACWGVAGRGAGRRRTGGLVGSFAEARDCGERRAFNEAAAGFCVCFFMCGLNEKEAAEKG